MKKIQIVFATTLCLVGICTSLLSPCFSKTIEDTTPAAKDLPWWIASHAQNVQAVQNGNFDVVIYGDSITEFMNEELMRKIIGEKTKNLGIKGDRTEHLLWRLQNGECDFKKQAPKVAVVLIGTNNLFHSKDEEIVAGIKTDVAELKKRLPSTKILIVGILPRGETTKAKSRGEIIAINTELAKTVDGKNIWYIDIGKNLTEPDGSISKSVMDDFLHPTKNVGYNKMLQALKPEIDKVAATSR